MIKTFDEFMNSNRVNENAISSDFGTKIRIDPNSTTYQILKYMWENNHTGLRYSDIVQFIMEELKGVKYDHTKHRGYWATNLTRPVRYGYGGYGGEEPTKAGLLTKYAEKNSEGRWILKDIGVIKHFNMMDGFTEDEADLISMII